MFGGGKITRKVIEEEMNPRKKKWDYWVNAELNARKYNIGLK